MTLCDIGLEMKFTSTIVLAAVLLLPAVADARDFEPVLYQKGNWRVMRGDNGPFEICLAQYAERQSSLDVLEIQKV